jgi:YegS/Rv2252/BmrU family lipid kinase
MKALCIYNPAAGEGKAQKHLEKIKKLFKRHLIDADFLYTRYPRHAIELVKDIDLRKYQALLVAGGDGSFFDALNGYMKNPTKDNTSLGILPVGTGNSLSRDVLNNTNSLDDFIRVIAEGKTQKFDIAKVQTTDNTFYFANMMGLGFISDVTKTASNLKIFNKLSYTLGVLYNTIKLKTNLIKLIADEKEFDLNNVFVIVSNSKYTGGDYLIAPKAEINDGKLDLIIVDKLSRLNLLKTFPKTFDGTHINTPFVQYIQATNIRFETDKQIQLSPDGELCCKLPAKILCIDKAVSIFVS